MLFSKHFVRSLSLLLAIFLVFSMAGCSASPTPEDSTSSSQEVSEISEQSDASESSLPESEPVQEKPKDPRLSYTKDVEIFFSTSTCPIPSPNHVKIFDENGLLVRDVVYKRYLRGYDGEKGLIDYICVYDEQGRLTQKVFYNDAMALSEIHLYEYDEEGRVLVETVQTPHSETIYTYQYDENGLLTAITDDGGTMNYTYDENGHLVKMDYNGSARYVLTYTYTDSLEIEEVKIETYPNKGTFTLTPTFDGDRILSEEIFASDGYYYFLENNTYHYINDDEFIILESFYKNPDGSPSREIGSPSAEHLYPSSLNMDLDFINHATFHVPGAAMNQGDFHIDSVSDEQGRIVNYSFVTLNNSTKEEYTAVSFDYSYGQPLTRQDYILYHILSEEDCDLLGITEEEVQTEVAIPVAEPAEQVTITADNLLDYFDLVPLPLCYTLADYNDTSLFYPYAYVLQLKEEYLSAYLENSHYILPSWQSSITEIDRNEIPGLLSRKEIDTGNVGTLEITVQLTVDDPAAQELIGFSEQTFTVSFGKQNYAEYLLDQAGTLAKAWQGAFPGVFCDLYSLGILKATMDASSFGPQEINDPSFFAEHVTVKILSASGTLGLY